MNQQTVVARYNESELGWLDQLPNVLLYNKGATFLDEHAQIELPNVGREAHTYLHHIVTRWDELADWTLFTQAKVDDHVGDFDLRQLFDSEHQMAGFKLLIFQRPWVEWDSNGRLNHRNHWLDRYRTGLMRHSRWTLNEWFVRHIGLSLAEIGDVAYFPGAIFAVRKEAIQRRPRSFWEGLLNQISDHADPEEAYYLERAWIYLFLGHGAPVTAWQALVPKSYGEWIPLAG